MRIEVGVTLLGHLTVDEGLDEDARDAFIREAVKKIVDTSEFDRAIYGVNFDSVIATP